MKALTPPEGSNPTIYQVAQRAGVSIATVSRALRGSDLVAPATRERIERAARELHFVPSRPARSLAEGRQAANGIVFPDLSGPYYADVVLGYEEAAAELGRSVLILATHRRLNAAELVRDLASRVDGMVIMGRTVSDDVVRGIATSGVPVVLLARPAVDDLDVIGADNAGPARDLTGHLLAHGYRRFGFLGDPDSSPDVEQRWHGLRAALTESGQPAPDRPFACALNETAGRNAATAALLGPDPPDVLVCANDEIALGAMLAAEELGSGVPGDLAITGWDDIMAARHVRPALTTLRQPMRELGAQAARTLDLRLTDPGAPATRVTLRTELVVRASCGAH
ncbi:LacI family DNA-binding transcriptional regulator [Flindersiella endophytica]